MYKRLRVRLCFHTRVESFFRGTKESEKLIISERFSSKLRLSLTFSLYVWLQLFLLSGDSGAYLPLVFLAGFKATAGVVLMSHSGSASQLLTLCATRCTSCWPSPTPLLVKRERERETFLGTWLTSSLFLAPCSHSKSLARASLDRHTHIQGRTSGICPVAVVWCSCTWTSLA